MPLPPTYVTERKLSAVNVPVWVAMLPLLYAAASAQLSMPVALGTRMVQRIVFSVRGTSFSLSFPVRFGSSTVIVA